MSAVLRRVVMGLSGTLRARKYGNKPTVRKGQRFHSQREANRYDQLALLEKNGEVRNIRLQVPYKCEVAGMLICRYHADFVYEEMRDREWREIVEDVKGFRTPAYKLKKKLMKACHGIEIRET